MAILIDSHAHLDFVENLKSTLEKAKNAGVSKIITIGTSLACSKKCIEIAENYSESDLQIFASCGIHPSDGRDDVIKYGDYLVNELEKIARSSKKVVAIGECGLDYFDKTSDKEKSEQKKLFKSQVKLACDLELPLVVHCRNGWGEIFDEIAIGKSENSKLAGVFHSWTGNLGAMSKALDLGFYISFSGIVTFGNAGEVVNVAQKVTSDKFLVETDSPFLSPEPLRGKKNSPANVRIIASFLSEIRNQTLAHVSLETSENASQLFNLS